MFSSVASSTPSNSAFSIHQPTGSFCYESSLTSNRYCSTPHHPLQALASHCIRLAFGDQVQWVADGLQSIGATGEQSAVTFSSLVTLLQRKQVSVTTCVKDGPLGSSSGFSTNNSAGKVMEKSAIRAALLVLIQHSIVSVRRKPLHGSTSSTNTKSAPCAYRYHPERAARLDGCRYARYVEHMKRAIDPSAAIVVEILLLHGRLRTVDVVLKTVQQMQQQQQDPDQPSSQHHKYTARETVVDAMAKLVRGGYFEFVPEISSPSSEDDAEHEFEQPPPKKKVKTEETPQKGSRSTAGKAADALATKSGEDPAILNLIQGNAQYKSTLPVDAVWRVNQNMFHDSIRALCLGRLVAELYGHKVQAAGSLVTAALKYRAFLEHSKGSAAAAVRSSDSSFFSPGDIVRFLPKAVVQVMEGKASKVGESVVEVITKAFMELSDLRSPIVVRRVGEDLFEVAHASLLQYLRKRVIHQLVEDRHGQVAARIVAILSQQGWLESDTLAKQVMVPEKDTRSILHELYRSRYIDLFQLSASHSSKQFYNPSTSMYLWCVHEDRLRRKVVDDVLTASRNLRLRRQHESEVVGREWIERARQTFDDENEDESDKMNQQKFELGLERIDVALQQLDETLLVLTDF